MTYNEMWRKLAQVYDEGEAKAVARMVYEVRYGLTLSDIYIGKDTQLSLDCQAELEEITKRLLDSEPVQYILGQADFYGRTFHVEPGVLIPRPETEHLCSLITKHVAIGSPNRTILDIGTGKIARENAKRANVHVSFEQVDILHLPSDILHHTFDLIVSNPPYICNKERAKMEQNVLAHEPHTALFVPDDDPLLFYRAIAQYGQTALNPDGELYFEINPLYADALKELLSTMSYHDIEIKDDQFGKKRFIQAIR